jgi:hypothetical protein
MLAFSFNVGAQACGSDFISDLLRPTIERVFGLEQGQTPQQYFAGHLASNYKLADSGKQGEEIELDDDEDEGNENDEEMKEETVPAKEDKLATSVEFRHWKSLARANHVLLGLISDVVYKATGGSEEDDEEYEEVEDDGAQEEAKEPGSSLYSTAVKETVFKIFDLVI